MDRVYVVFGASGEYSDASEWPVRAFEAQADADAFVAECEAAAKARPKQPRWVPAGGDGHERYVAARARWSDRIGAFIAASPDDRMPQEDHVDYSVATVPFGIDSTALSTAAPRLSQRMRSYDLTSESEP